jgi:hypothetical protein
LIQGAASFIRVCGYLEHGKPPVVDAAPFFSKTVESRQAAEKVCNALWDAYDKYMSRKK